MVSGMTSSSPDLPWRDRFSVSGWALLPLRLFLGFTLLYAGLLKLTDPNYFDATSSSSVQAQMLLAIKRSPISLLISQAAEHATLSGLVIAVGEVAVGISVLLGLWSRLGALGGFLLSLSFFLTVSWGTSPYFFGPDIVFMAAFVPLMLAGDGGVWSVGALIRARTMREAGLVAGSIAQVAPADLAVVDRRVLLRTGGVAVGAGVLALVVGGVARTFGGRSASETAGGAATTSPSPSPSAKPSTSSSAKPTATSSPSASASATAKPVGTKIGAATDVPVGTAFSFDAPDGNPAYVVQPAAGTYLAYSRVCPHQGCSVDFTGQEFACPCHGAVFAEGTGDAISGPARSPLQKYQVTESGGSLYVV